MTNEEYHAFIQPYGDAKEVPLARLNVLKHNLYSEFSGQPIHNIQSRMKSKGSIEGKLHKKEKEPTIMNAKDYLQDIAGVRVICYFVDDIYNLADALKRQSDLIVIRERDYIASPKPNGYRSFHVIVGIPVYCLDGMEYFPVEVQFRTMSMDFWASMEHRILYKMERDDREHLAAELKEYAEYLVEIEGRFEQYSVGNSVLAGKGGSMEGTAPEGDAAQGMEGTAPEGDAAQGMEGTSSEEDAGRLFLQRKGNGKAPKYPAFRWNEAYE